MKVLFIGDVVGNPGRRALKQGLPDLISKLKIDFVIANVENAAGGFHARLAAGAVVPGAHATRSSGGRVTG